MAFNAVPQEVHRHLSVSSNKRNSIFFFSHEPETVPKTVENGAPPWKPTTRLYLALLTLSVITMMVALDGTSLSVALPVC